MELKFRYGVPSLKHSKAIAVDDDGQLVGPISEAAKLQEFRTELIVTSTSNYATPVSDQPQHVMIALTFCEVTLPMFVTATLMKRLRSMKLAARVLLIRW